MNNFLRKYRLRKLAMGGFTMDRPELQSAKGEGIIGKSVLQGAMSGIGAGNSLFGAGSALASAGGQAAGLLGKAGGPIGMAASVLAGAGIGLLTGSKQRKKQDEAYKEQYNNEMNEYNTAKSNYFAEKLNQDRQALIDRDNQLNNQMRYGGYIPQYQKGGSITNDKPPQNLYSMDELMRRARQEANYMPTSSTLVAPSQKTQNELNQKSNYTKTIEPIDKEQVIKEKQNLAKQPQKMTNPIEQKQNMYLNKKHFLSPMPIDKKNNNENYTTYAGPYKEFYPENTSENRDSNLIDWYKLIVLGSGAVASEEAIRRGIKKYKNFKNNNTNSNTPPSNTPPSNAAKSSNKNFGSKVRGFGSKVRGFGSKMRGFGSASKSVFPFLNITGTTLELLNEQKKYNKMTPRKRYEYDQYLEWKRKNPTTPDIFYQKPVQPKMI